VTQDRGSAKPGIRPIEKRDNAVVADITRLVMSEFQAIGCGYSSNDAEVDDMFGAYSTEDSAFYVVELAGRVLGCGGFGPLQGGEKDTCELRKMYFKAELRGLGVGTKLLGLCLEEASRAGYRRCKQPLKSKLRRSGF
jgi:putative acetyltransferase